MSTRRPRRLPEAARTASTANESWCRFCEAPFRPKIFLDKYLFCNYGQIFVRKLHENRQNSSTLGHLQFIKIPFPSSVVRKLRPKLLHRINPCRPSSPNCAAAAISWAPTSGSIGSAIRSFWRSWRARSRCRSTAPTGQMLPTRTQDHAC
jgi:hypothetical protein